MNERESNRVNHDNKNMDIDIDRLSKSMPYKPLSDKYFEQLPYDTLAKLRGDVEQENIELNNQSRPKYPHALLRKHWRLSLPIQATIAASAAAVALIGVYFSIGMLDRNKVPTLSEEDQIAEFVATLSDSDLTLIIEEAESNYEFYTNL